MSIRHMTPVVLARTIAEGEDFVRLYPGLRGAIIVPTGSRGGERMVEGLAHPVVFFAPGAEMGRHVEQVREVLRRSALRRGAIPRQLAWGIHG